MEKLLLPILIPLIIFSMMMLLLVFKRKKERERTEAMQILAGQLGWTFAASAPLDCFSGAERFPIFNQGNSKEITNLMYGDAKGIKTVVFDYLYILGSGKNRRRIYQTIVYLEPANLALPYFSIRHKDVFHKPISVVGSQDINFGQRPEFSKHYVLRGPDEPAIRSAVSDALLSFYESNSGICTDAGGKRLFVYRSAYRCQPAEVQGDIGLSLNLLSLLPQS